MNANMLVVGWVALEGTWNKLHNFMGFSEYEVSGAPGQVIDYEVRDTKQHILSKKDDISRGKFSFTSEVFDVYELCFISKVPSSKNFVNFHWNFLIHLRFLDVRAMPQEVSVTVKKGVETKSYEGVSCPSSSLFFNLMNILLLLLGEKL